MRAACPQCRLVQDQVGSCEHCGRAVVDGWRSLATLDVVGVGLARRDERWRPHFLHGYLAIFAAPGLGVLAMVALFGPIGLVLGLPLGVGLGITSFVLAPRLRRRSRLHPVPRLPTPVAEVHAGTVVALRQPAPVTTVALVSQGRPLLRLVETAEPFVLAGASGELLVTGTLWFEPDEPATSRESPFGSHELTLPDDATLLQGIVRAGDRLTVSGTVGEEMSSGGGYREGMRRVLRGVPGRPLVLTRLAARPGSSGGSTGPT